MLPQRESGFTLLGLLFLMMVLGIALAAVGTVWETAARREKEAELLFVGDQYRRALESYYRATPGQAKRYPASLSDLVKDNRFPNAVRHLRRLYHDPMTQGEQWGEVKEGNEIVGVYSLYLGTPLKQGGFAKDYADFEGKESYLEWVFLARKDPADREVQDQAAGQGEQRKLKELSPEEKQKCAETREASVAVCEASYPNEQDPARQQCFDAANQEHLRCAYFK